MTRKVRSTKPNPAFAKSLCTCGHVGDGLHSEHAGGHKVSAGHGPCGECACSKFTWERFLTVAEQSEYLAQLRVVNE